MLKSNNRRLGIILNPAAGKGRASKIEKRLVKSLRTKNIPFLLEKTIAPGHATGIARDLCKECNIIVSVGGDGTLNETAAGMLESNSALGIVPIGSGNDFNKIIGTPKNVEQALDWIINGEIFSFDYGKIKYWPCNNIKKEGIFINTLGLGLDAEIAYNIKNIRYLSGLPLYLVSAIKSIALHSPNRYKMLYENKTQESDAFFICLGNGNYEGGGFKLLPDAKPDDGYLDICKVGPMPIMKALRSIPNLITGNYKRIETITTWKTKKIIFEAQRVFALHADGEVLEQKTKKVEVTIKPKGIRVIRAKH
jgi:diacylglycerol kinase (ATP)